MHDFNYENHELNEQLKLATATGEKKVPQPPSSPPADAWAEVCMLKCTAVHKAVHSGAQ